MRENRLCKVCRWVCVLGSVIVILAMSGPVLAEMISDEILVSGVYFETPIKEILEDISGKVKVNILTDSSVQGIVTIELRDIPLERALTMILAPGGYTFRDMGGYYLVGAVDSENPAFIHLSETQVIKLSYVPADIVLSVLPDIFARLIKVNPASNSLVVTGSPELIKRIREDVAKIDQPTHIVGFDVVIAELSPEDAKKLLDVDLSGEFMAPQRYEVETYADLLDSFRYGRVKERNGFMDKLNKLADEGVIRIYASPKIATPDSAEAQVFIGRDVELYLWDEQGDMTRQIAQVGTTLKLQPRILGHGEIVLSISPEISEIVRPRYDNPYVSRRYVTIDIRVANGETVVISGVPYDRQEGMSVRVPLIGSLFKGAGAQSGDSSLMVFITTRILGAGVE